MVAPLTKETEFYLLARVFDEEKNQHTGLFKYTLVESPFQKVSVQPGDISYFNISGDKSQQFLREFTKNQPVFRVNPQIAFYAGRDLAEFSQVFAQLLQDCFNEDSLDSKLYH